MTGTVAKAGPAALPLLSGPAAQAVHTYTVKGPLSGITGQITIELPPGYSAAANAAVRYPVLETFGGYPGSPGQWIRTMNLGGAIASGVAAHQVRSALHQTLQVSVTRTGRDIRPSSVHV